MERIETMAEQMAAMRLPLVCNQPCPYGGKCCLSADAPHTLHVCCQPRCDCHSERRYRHEARKAREVNHE